jgi:hypothetical protein
MLKPSWEDKCLQSGISGRLRWDLVPLVEQSQTRDPVSDPVPELTDAAAGLGLCLSSGTLITSSGSSSGGVSFLSWHHCVSLSGWGQLCPSWLYWLVPTSSQDNPWYPGLPQLICWECLSLNPVQKGASWFLWRKYNRANYFQWVFLKKTQLSSPLNAITQMRTSLKSTHTHTNPKPNTILTPGLTTVKTSFMYLFSLSLV